VRVIAASINPSDVKNVAGAMSQTSAPRIPGRDVAGVVEAGPAEWIGVEVWGTSDDTGFTRDGTHAELIAVPVASLRRKPKTRSFRIGRDGRRELYGRLVGSEAAALKSGDRELDRRWRRCRQRRRPDRLTPRRPRDRSGQARAGSQRANSRHS
jgi:NADPH2:quinone reductase